LKHKPFALQEKHNTHHRKQEVPCLACYAGKQQEAEGGIQGQRKPNGKPNM